MRKLVTTVVVIPFLLLIITGCNTEVEHTPSNQPTPNAKTTEPEESDTKSPAIEDEAPETPEATELEEIEASEVEISTIVIGDQDIDIISQDVVTIKPIELWETSEYFVSPYDTIGLHEVETSDGNHFIVEVESSEEPFDENGVPTNGIPYEGGLGKMLYLRNNVTGYEYLSNAMGFIEDAHITIFRGETIIYLRQREHEKEVTPELREFARTLIITE
jgi:PBP1b-binding outer membrane lipoprotein LpoB